ncbi:MAG: 50S ribosomal protein L13 [Candidatus Hydrogenedentota bacterium]
MKTYVPHQGDIEQRWLVLDAKGKVLGRVAAEAAKLLRGKHKPQYTPYLDCGDHVVIINADKARVTGRKARTKKYYRHSGYLGNLKETTYEKLIAKHPTRAMMFAVKGMLPHNKLGRKLATRVRIYAGDEHPHEAQNPQTHTF